MSVLLDASGPGVPAVLHWGADLGDATARRGRPVRPPRPHSAPDVPWRRSTLLAGNVGADPAPAGAAWRPAPGRRAGCWPDVEHGDQAAQVTCTATEAGLTLVTHLGLDDARRPAGAARAAQRRHHGVRRATGSACVLPVPPRGDRAARPDRALVPRAAPAAAALGCAGHLDPRLPARPHRARRDPAAGGGHPGLRLPARTRCTACTWRGAATRAAGPSAGRTGARCSATAELLGPGEVVLEPGESYRTPDVLAVFSDDGLDGLSRRLHRHVRARPSHPRRPRPVVLNTWEAVYFDHRLDRLTGLADVAASIGVERFVLDDGWFLHRRHDRAGLGDWTVDPDVWPDGLGPADRARPRPRHGVRALGRAGDGQRGLRPLPGAPRLGAAGRRRACRWPGGTSRCSTSACPRPGSTCSSGSTPCCATTTSGT